MNYQNIDDMSDEQLRVLQSMVSEDREKDKLMYETIDNIVKNGIPKNETEFKILIKNFVERKDFVKTLLEKLKIKLGNSIKNWQDYENEELNYQINNAVYEYLAVISTLNDLKCDLKSPKISQYNPYYVDLYLPYLSDIMYKRKINGCNIDIFVPNKYGTNNKFKLDAVRSIYFIELEIDGQVIDWKKYASSIDNHDIADNFENVRRGKL